MDLITYAPIGVIRTPYTQITGMPVHAVATPEVVGTVEIAPEYAAGLRDLDDFSHLILLYHLHEIRGHALEVRPYLAGADDPPRGVFATRSPKRPNPIGLAVVRLIGIDGHILRIAGVDMLDNTPLLDIKPYVPAFDARPADRIGWYAGNLENVARVRADERFHGQRGN